MHYELMLMCVLKFDELHVLFLADAMSLYVALLQDLDHSSSTTIITCTCVLILFEQWASC